MRVLYCTDTFPPQVNGVSVVTALSVTGMQARGWDVHVLAPRYPAPSPGIVTTVPSVPLPFYPEVRMALASAPAARRAVAAFAPDLVHCETEFFVGRAGQAAAIRAGIPVVTSYHTNFSKYAEAYRMPWLEGPVGRHLARFHRRASRTFTPSEASRDDLRRLGVPDVEVWGRGVDATRFNPARRSAALRARLGLGDAFTFLYVGRLANEKSVDVVLAADEYLDDDLVGCTVLDTNGAPLGHVAGVEHFPAQDILLVGAARAMLPFVRAFVRSVDVAAKQIVVDVPPGLIDPGEAAEA